MRKQFKVKGVICLQCKHCEKIKPTSDFYWFSGQKSWRPACKECDKIKDRERYRIDKIRNFKPRRMVLGTLAQEDFYALTIKELGL